MRKVIIPQRLKGFDYRTPFFYMVSIHARPDLREVFSRIGPQGCIVSPLTRAYVRVVRTLHTIHPDIEPITCFTVMPDHLHLLVKMRENAVNSLIEVIGSLKESLATAYFTTTNAPRPPAPEGFANFVALSSHVFAPGFHDYVVKSAGQLKYFTHYIRTNPQRNWTRTEARRNGWFNRVHFVDFAGCRWYAYGNAALLDLPVIVSLKGHRVTRPDTPAWQALLDRAARIGPGSAGISTFMSPHEKACGRVLGLAGGNWIVLSPEGFIPSGSGTGYETKAGEPTRWHPGERKEKWCACGRMLFLSLWEGTPRKLDRGEFSRRCHEMGDVVARYLDTVGI